MDLTISKRSINRAAIKKIAKTRYVKLLMLHVGIAFVIYMFEPLSLLYFISVFGYFLFIILDRKNKNNEALMAAAYIAGVEVFWRMTGGIVFYETGKYSVILFLLIGMFFKGTSTKTKPYWIYLLILVPGIFIASQTINYDAVFRKAIAFNLSGPVTLGLTAVYCYYKKIKRVDFEKVLLMLLLPLITNMAYLYIYTPRLDEALISMSGNYAATAGYGPNQISTIMGLGAFLLLTRLFVIKSKLINIIDLGLLILMSYRAIVTFSRGGVFTAVVCAIAFIAIYLYKQKFRDGSSIKTKLIIISAAVFLTWTFTTILSSGLIVNRYTNRDAAGRLKDDITTGRAELLSTELDAFYQNPVWGVGVGNIKFLREEEIGEQVATHNEVSRLLAEHGLLGLLAILILIFVPLLFWFKFRNNYYFLAFVCFWFLTINHSAMRIALPAFVYGLALLYIVDEKKNTLYR